MDIRRSAIVGVLCTGLLGGCAGMQTHPHTAAHDQHLPFFCAMAGAAISGVGVGVVAAGGPAAIAGVAIGAGLGYIACLEDEPAPVAQPVAERPMTFPIIHHEEPRPAPAPEVSLGIIPGIHFDFDKYNLKPSADTILNDVARKMQAAPSMRARIEGHTDSIGSDEYNMGLGQRRANTVRDALISRGIGANRLSTVSKGEREPVANNSTAAGRAQNRRVEIIGINN